MPWYQHPIPPDQDPRRTKKPTCSKCGQRVVYVRSARKKRPIPCNVDQKYGDGEVTLVTWDGHMIPKAGPEILGREPHFGRNCPEGSLERIEQFIRNLDLD